MRWLLVLLRPSACGLMSATARIGRHAHAVVASTKTTPDRVLAFDGAI
jgi:hypothetical protein